MRGGDLKRLDVALLALRRFADAPASSGGSTLVHGSERVEVSTVLVVDAVARRGAGEECSISTVAEELRVAHSTASRLIDRAVRVGMVRRTRSSTDPRRTVLTLSTAGWQLQRDAIAFRTGRLQELLTDWTADEVTTFTQLLERFARSARPVNEKTS
ncbi:hypothetical protein NPS01_28580 [Nocardioides psychrotolerans]|uniref:DNA-binding transcriptional regulator, MarR family n=1 Tax=Nocardioides psychrotolerans TaxID=1005945 RepID=A0A1I3EQK0_9ACTN|nr:MarR family winged helix-turn-helix transcriptional regulator [Nocardioides psychrotolerans]GEP39195.1 hypothetical protein NPS01_28580 [Nocardioides psychrotolerans]SFI01276.1 DNA-binding transcriptional regulator, MarR family [Nocardioides psychrotolerans]